MMAPPAGPRRALYLRWRPARFGDVLGQEHVTRTLRNAVAAGQVAHAYLLCGPRGTGKTSIARILFKAINCAAPRDGDACDACPSCQDAASNRALDLIEIDAASNRGIDHIRELREKVWITPARARRKMYILDEAHQLSAPAWDAFLKTLEEPPPHVVFVLATTEVHKVPATILSRCQRFDLGRIAQAELVAHLAHVVASEGLRAEPAVLQRVARLARGGVRDALSTLDQLVAYGGEALTMRAAREVLGLTTEESLRQATGALAERDAGAALHLVNTLAQEGADLRQFLDDLVEHLRAVLLARVGAHDVLTFEFGPEEQVALASQASAWTPGQLVALVRRLSAIDPRGRDAGQLQVDLELTFLEATLGSTSGAAPPLPPPILGGVSERGAAPRAGAREAAPASPPGPSAVRDAGPDYSLSPSLGGEGQGAEAPLPAPPSRGERDGGASSGLPRDEGARGATSDPPQNEGARGAAPDSPQNGGVNGGLHGGAPPADALVRHRWTEVKEAVAVRLAKAAIPLEMASVGGLQDGELLLAFTDPWHRGTIETDAACLATIEEVLAEQLGLHCRVRCVAAEDQQPALLADAFLREAVALFGASDVVALDGNASGREEHTP